MPAHKKDHAAAFTLLELLVVVAIIALLAGLLLPALGGAKQRAHSAVCKNNLREWLTAVRLYLDDYEVYPSGEVGRGADSLWHRQLVPYTQVRWPDSSREGGPSSILRETGNGIYVCPGYARLGGGYADYWGSYGYNRGGTAINPYKFGLAGELLVSRVRPIREAEILAPGNMIAMGDTVLRYRTGGGWVTGLLGFNNISPVEPLNLWPVWTQLKFASVYPGVQQDIQANQRRHGGGWNVAFCDGHIESLKLRQLFDLRDEQVLKRWNNDNLPHRELVPKWGFSW